MENITLTGPLIPSVSDTKFCNWIIWICRFEVLDEEPGDDEEGGGQRYVCLKMPSRLHFIDYYFFLFSLVLNTSFVLFSKLSASAAT